MAIDSIVPDTKHQLKSPVDELEKAIKLLKLENEKLKNQIPKLSVTFGDGQKLAKYEIFKNSIDIDKFISSEMAKVKEEYQRYKSRAEIERERELENVKKKETNHNPLNTQSQLRQILESMQFPEYFGITEEEKGKYNSELLIFYGQYENFLRKLCAYQEFKGLTIEVNFELLNDGFAPAEDIDLYFHFPDGFELFDGESYPEEPSPPKAPYKRSSLLNISFPHPPPMINFPTNIGNLPVIKPNVSRPAIKKTNSYDVDIHVEKLKHNQAAILDKMLVVFESHESIINFNVGYELRCSNVPDVVEGKLNFVIEKKDSI